MDRDYSNHTPDAVPGFTIPLTDKELLLLGRLSAIWAQIDFLIDGTLDIVFRLDAGRRSVLIGDRPVGAKIKLLKGALPLMESGKFRKAIGEFVDAADSLLNERNHAAHGVWAWRALRSERAEVSARAARSPSTPLKPQKLKRLVARMAECSRLGVKMLEVVQMQKIKTPAILYYGKPRETPDWLSKLS